ncbi:MAG: hypothetical protein ACI97A_001554 [Planctomycetota bacterium]|jgi:hypothetical protein
MPTVFACFLVALAACVNTTWAQRGPIQVFILAGQSNMEGQGRVAHLLPLAESKKTEEEFGHLRRGDKWGEQQDVWISYDRTRGGRKTGKLTVGYGSNDKQIGPELGFGRVVGEAISEQVLLIKCSWGDSSLKKEFLPPSAGGPGLHFIKMINEVRSVLTQLNTLFPKSRGKTYQLAGFVWFQGRNDSVDEDNDLYAEQLAHLIRDVRKEFAAPNLPFIIGEPGQSGSEPDEEAVAFQAQQKAVTNLPEFAGSIRYVPTSTCIDAHLLKMIKIRDACKEKVDALPKGSDADAKDEAWTEFEPLRDEWNERIASQPHYFYGNGEVFYRIGTAFGQAMLALLPGVEPTTPTKTGPVNRPTKKKPDPTASKAIKDSAFDYVAYRKTIQPKIDTAIDSGADWLMSRQLRDGSWGSRQNGYPTGQTALSIYTLLKSGQGPEQSSVKRGLDFILRHDIKKTYSVGCALMALEAAGANRYKARIKELHEYLISIQHDDGGWSYDDNIKGATDLSNTQYAALGLRAANLAGLNTPSKTLKDLAEYTLRLQLKAKKMLLPASAAELEKYGPPEALVAGFTYREPAYRAAHGGKATGSMTCAGISILAIVRNLYGKKTPRAMKRRMQRGIDYGENFLRAYWSVKRNPGGGGWLHYYLYGLERAGALLMKEVLAAHPWFVEGAEYLVNDQKEEGHWANSEDATCFALLFLQRATWHKGGISQRQVSKSTHLSEIGAVQLMGTGTVKLSVWIRGFSEETKERFKSTAEQSNIRIIAIEYLVDGEIIARKDGDTTHDWRDESYANLHEFKRNGNYKISTRVHVLPPGIREQNVDTELEVLESEPFTVYVQKVKDPYLNDIVLAVSQGLLRDANLRNVASSVRKSAGPPQFATDGREGTSWVADKTDENPRLNVQVTRGVSARFLLISPSPVATANGEVESIEVKFNGTRRAHIATPAFGRGAVRIDLGKRLDIMSLKIKLTKKTPGTEVGIAELYFLR